MTTTIENGADGIALAEQTNKMTPAAGQEVKWAEHLSKAITPVSSLSGIKLPPREPIIGSWFKQGDLGFLCGERGIGKTWLGMLLARKCAEGGGIGSNLPEWQVHRQCRVLYVDGEMPLDAIRERNAALTAGGASGLSFLQHEALFHLTGQTLNLTDPALQKAILERCRLEKIDILFLDNQSCLFLGLRENDASAWDAVLPWLLELRRNRIAVVIIAHAGRNGAMRGSSRREDSAFWIIDLSEAEDSGEMQQGTRFVTQFLKNRNTTENECPPLKWTFVQPPNDPKVQVSWEKITTLQLFRQCVENGYVKATDIAKQLGISRFKVSRFAARAIKEGWLKKTGRNYAITPPDPMARWTKVR
jgi:putative DNA primase/helicase